MFARSFLLNLSIMPMKNFYEKELFELTDDEWEKICMRCGKCCMCKYSEDGFIHFSNQMCRFFDMRQGICSCYDRRFEVNSSDCRKISFELLQNNLSLLPPSCAYRRLYEGRGLPSYHPLLTGKKLPAKYTVAAMPVFSETDADEARAKVIMEGIEKKWDGKRIWMEQKKIAERFKLKWLETYPEAKEPTVK